MVPAPPEVSQRRGRSKRRYCAAHIWCWPTSVETIASRPAMRLLQRRHQLLRQDASLRGAKSRQRSRAPALDALPPGREPLRRARPSSAGMREQRLQHRAAIADHRHVDLHHLVDLRGIDVDVDLARVRAELVQLAGHAVVEARADADHQVGFVHRQVGFQRAVHAEHAEKARSDAGNAPRPISVSVQGASSCAHQPREGLAGRRARS